jgi:negative regulator of sigma E activity
MSVHKAQTAVLATVTLGAAAAALAADDARGWLERMEHALATRNYQGTFVHEHAGQTDTTSYTVSMTTASPSASRPWMVRAASSCGVVAS